MITRDEAYRIAREKIASQGSDIAVEDSLILVDSATVEKEWGWVFFYTSKLWYETNDFRYAMVGNAPFIVERESGRILGLGTAFTSEHYIENYEKHGDPHFQPGPGIRLAGRSREVDVMAAVKLLRDRLGIGLLAAKQIIEDCLAGRRPAVTATSKSVAAQLAEDLESMGFLVERLPLVAKPDVI